MATGRQWVRSFGVGLPLWVVGCSWTGPARQYSASGGNGGLDGAAVDGGSNGFMFTVGTGGGAGVGNDCVTVFWDSPHRDGGAKDAGHTDRGGSDGGHLDAGEPGDGAAFEGGAVFDGGGPADAEAHTDATAPGTPSECRLPLDAIGPSRLDPERVSITLSVDDSFQGFILLVPSCSVDGGANGITYNNPASPTELILCPSSCDWFMSHHAHVSAHFSCREYFNPW